jgi:FRG domain
MSEWKNLYFEYRENQHSRKGTGKPPTVGATDLQRKRSEPFDDVYHAALCMVFSAYNGAPRWKPHPDCQRVFRGQRHEWPVIPKLYRNSETNENVSAEVLRITTLVRYLQSLHTDLTDEQGVAIAQHYSDEAQVKTWLIDVTWHPFVALFFASLGGQADDLGVVWSLERDDWEQFSAGGTNRLGAIRIVTVPGVPRMNAQRAAFIDTSHPDLFEQFIPYTIWFKQTPGLVFEDPFLEPSITKDVLFPRKDPFSDEARSTDLPRPVHPLAIIPHTSGPLSGADYLAIVENCWKANAWIFNERLCKRLSAICEFHSRIQRLRDRVPIERRSLRRLDSASTKVYLAERESRTITLYDALESTFNGMSSHDSLWLLLREVAKDVERQVGW